MSTAYGDYAAERFDAELDAQRRYPTTRAEDRRAAEVGCRVEDLPTRAELEAEGE